MAAAAAPPADPNKITFKHSGFPPHLVVEIQAKVDRLKVFAAPYIAQCKASNLNLRITARNSLIEGIGLIPKEVVPAGTIVAVHYAEFYPKDPITAEVEYSYDHWIPLSDGMDHLIVSDGLPMLNHFNGLANKKVKSLMLNTSGGFINHGCRYKCNVKVVTIPDPTDPTALPLVVFQTDREVAPLKELCADYNQTRADLWHKLMNVLAEGYHPHTIVRCNCKTTRNFKHCPHDLAFSAFQARPDGPTESWIDYLTSSGAAPLDPAVLVAARTAARQALHADMSAEEKFKRIKAASRPFRTAAAAAAVAAAAPAAPAAAAAAP